MNAAPATLAALLRSLPVMTTEVTANSRDVRRGSAFLAYPGALQDGRNFIDDAIARGAAAILFDPANYVWDPIRSTPSLAVPALKNQASAIAGEIYGHPSRALWMTGVTGTNGKTSVAQWTAQAFAALGLKSAVLGTIGNGIVPTLRPSEATTLDAVLLQRQLRDFVKQEAVTCAMEVSSHGLDQARVADIKFNTAIFTNLTRDHLDYHGTMAAYGEAKAKLFAMPGLQHAVINADDAFGQQLIERLAATRTDGNGKVSVIGTSIRADSTADLVAKNLAVSASGLAFDIDGKFGAAHVRSPILGAFNAANLLAVIGGLLAHGVSLDDAARLASALPPVPGRMQSVRDADPSKPLLVVDYAHTPDALLKALTTLAAIVPKHARLISVFGCGGDRDRGKRAEMGRISAQHARASIITSDNPRTENPQRIIEDIEAGMVGARYRAIPDRQQAIYEALNDAHSGDIVLIAGKGHENYQIIGDTRHHFSDVEVAVEALSLWRGVAK